ncbi:MAG: Rieske 2Fe-2S domain-containing protein [Planctomycetes bacterium]|nr:Rieske 2Fe-2S domain-containing protein [Planctomycetota bacterium]
MTASFDTGLRPADLDRARPRAVETPWGMLALYCVGDEILAAQAFCPHLEGPLFEGTLRADEIVCPWHQWRYSLRTGERVGIGALLAPGGQKLLLADVTLSDRGTIVLVNPHRGGERIAPTR